MKRVFIGKWKWKQPNFKKFILFEYIHSACGCYLITICNVCIEILSKACYEANYGEGSTDQREGN